MTKQQRKKLDIIWQQKVTKNKPCSYPGCCKIGNEGHHIFKRRYLNVRWSVENGRALCRECHLEAHNNPQAYEDCIVDEIGIEGYAILREKAYAVKKRFYDEILKELKEGIC
jgi:hypothetical protein